MARGFRVWDKQEKTYSDKAFSIDQLGICYIQDEDGYWEEIDDSRFIVEFETGLTDKNADMICEGDIVDYAGECTCVVQYEDEGARFIHRDISDDFPFGFNGLGEYNGKLFEVIGNIHENPELLDNSIHGPYGPIGEENIGGESRRMQK